VIGAHRRWRGSAGAAIVARSCTPRIPQGSNRGRRRWPFGTQRGALLGYAGYEWAKRNPGAYPSAAQRLNIIAGWKACETKLLDVRPFGMPERSEQDVILGALNSAKPFGALRETFRPLLFRAGDYA
jgi:hypothetical protein